MLVALVVLSLSLGVLYQAATSRNVGGRRIHRCMVAESMLARQLRHGGNLSAAGQFEIFQWTVSSWPALYDDGRDERAVAATPLQYLQVVVSWRGAVGSPRNRSHDSRSSERAGVVKREAGMTLVEVTVASMVFMIKLTVVSASGPGMLRPVTKKRQHIPVQNARSIGFCGGAKRRAG